MQYILSHWPSFLSIDVRNIFFVVELKLYENVIDPCRTSCNFKIMQPLDGYMLRHATSSLLMHIFLEDHSEGVYTVSARPS